MKRGLALELVWFDEDVVELRATASNGRFAGAATFYADYDATERLADMLRGFPSSADDRRELELGTFDPRGAKGGAHIGLLCTDAAGHCVLRIRLRADPHDRPGGEQTADFPIGVEPAAIDRFVQELEAMERVAGARAELDGTS